MIGLFILVFLAFLFSLWFTEKSATHHPDNNADR